jgi:ribosomal protein L12E/L44/L45/RPP1/RPP2
MAKYSDDAKYVAAYNRGLKAANTAKLLLAELNKAKPGTPQHTSLKAKYDTAKAAADTAEAERVARKEEIDQAAQKEPQVKAAAKAKESAKKDIPQLQYQLQAATNEGNPDKVKAAQEALKAAQDTVMGIKPPAQGEKTVLQDGGLEEVANNKFKDYTINSDGSVAGPGGTRSYFVSVKNADGSSTLQEYKSAATARDAFLKGYSAPGALDKLKQQLRSRNYISASQLRNNDWIRGLDDMLGDYTRDAVSAVKYSGAKQAPLIDSWFAKASSGTGTTSKAGTWTDTDLDFTTRGDANKEINDYMIDALGREATQEEKDAYYKDINEREKKSAVKTVDVRDATGKITKTTRTGDFVTAEERLNARNAIVIKALEGTDAAEILKSAKGSQVAVQIGQLQKAAADYGQPISAGEALKYVIEGGTQKDAIAKQTERLRLNSMTMYGNLKDHIQNGGTVKDIADQYALIKSRKLGIPVTDAFNDKDVKAAITRDGGLMSTAEFARQMQANPLWRQTDEAREVASDFTNTILKSFGLMG